MIIADTNIWFRIKENTDFDHLKKIGLLPTYINLYELGSSSLLFRKPKLAHKGFVNINKFLDLVIIHPPFQQILFNNYRINFDISFANNLIQNIDTISKAPLNIYLETSEKMKTQLMEGIEEINNHFSKSTLSSNELLKSIQKQFSNGAQTKSQNREDKQEFIKKRENELSSAIKLFKFIVKDKLGHEITDNDLLQKELFMRVINEYFLSLEIKEREEIQDNDWNDLLLMLYVDKGDYFWTAEKKWLKIIKKLNLQHYLFDGEIYLHKAK